MKKKYFQKNSPNKPQFLMLRLKNLLCIKIHHSSRLGKEFFQTTFQNLPSNPFAKLLVSP